MASGHWSRAVPSGIGEAIAKVLAKEGAAVVVQGRQEKEAERVAQEIAVAVAMRSLSWAICPTTRLRRKSPRRRCRSSAESTSLSTTLGLPSGRLE
jgi:NAD(P)-dependent dehydrogenase (short-subunit alcohol dehydrogenase family)